MLCEALEQFALGYYNHENRTRPPDIDETTNENVSKAENEKFIRCENASSQLAQKDHFEPIKHFTIKVEKVEFLINIKNDFFIKFNFSSISRDQCLYHFVDGLINYKCSVNNLNVFLLKKSTQQIYYYNTIGHLKIDDFMFIQQTKIECQQAQSLVDRLKEYDSQFGEVCFSWGTVKCECSSGKAIAPCTEDKCNCFKCLHYFCSPIKGPFLLDNISIIDCNFQLIPTIDVKAYIDRISPVGEKKSSFIRKSKSNQPDRNSHQESFNYQSCHSKKAISRESSFSSYFSVKSFVSCTDKSHNSLPQRENLSLESNQELSKQEWAKFCINSCVDDIQDSSANGPHVCYLNSELYYASDIRLFEKTINPNYKHCNSFCQSFSFTQHNSIFLKPGSKSTKTCDLLLIPGDGVQLCLDSDSIDVFNTMLLEMIEHTKYSNSLSKLVSLHSRRESNAMRLVNIITIDRTPTNTENKHILRINISHFSFSIADLHENNNVYPVVCCLDGLGLNAMLVDQCDSSNNDSPQNTLNENITNSLLYESNNYGEFTVDAIQAALYSFGCSFDSISSDNLACTKGPLSESIIFNTFAVEKSNNIDDDCLHLLMPLVLIAINQLETTFQYDKLLEFLQQPKFLLLNKIKQDNETNVLNLNTDTTPKCHNHHGSVGANILVTACEGVRPKGQLSKDFSTDTSPMFVIDNVSKVEKTILGRIKSIEIEVCIEKWSKSNCPAYQNFNFQLFHSINAVESFIYSAERLLLLYQAWEQLCFDVTVGLVNIALKNSTTWEMKNYFQFHNRDDLCFESKFICSDPSAFILWTIEGECRLSSYRYYDNEICLKNCNDNRWYNFLHIPNCYFFKKRNLYQSSSHNASTHHSAHCKSCGGGANKKYKLCDTVVNHAGLNFFTFENFLNSVIDSTYFSTTSGIVNSKILVPTFTFFWTQYVKDTSKPYSIKKTPFYSINSLKFNNNLRFTSNLFMDYNLVLLYGGNNFISIHEINLSTFSVTFDLPIKVVEKLVSLYTEYINYNFQQDLKNKFDSKSTTRGINNRMKTTNKDIYDDGPPEWIIKVDNYKNPKLMLKLKSKIGRISKTSKPSGNSSKSRSFSKKDASKNCSIDNNDLIVNMVEYEKFVSINNNLIHMGYKRLSYVDFSISVTEFQCDLRVECFLFTLTSRCLFVNYCYFPRNISVRSNPANSALIYAQNIVLGVEEDFAPQNLSKVPLIILASKFNIAMVNSKDISDSNLILYKMMNLSVNSVQCPGYLIQKFSILNKYILKMLPTHDVMFNGSNDTTDLGYSPVTIQTDNRVTSDVMDKKQIISNVTIYAFHVELNLMLIPSFSLQYECSNIFIDMSVLRQYVEKCVFQINDHSICFIINHTNKRSVDNKLPPIMYSSVYDSKSSNMAINFNFGFFNFFLSADLLSNLVLARNGFKNEAYGIMDELNKIITDINKECGGATIARISTTLKQTTGSHHLSTSRDSIDNENQTLPRKDNADISYSIKTNLDGFNLVAIAPNSQCLIFECGKGTVVFNDSSKQEINKNKSIISKLSSYFASSDTNFDMSIKMGLTESLRHTVNELPQLTEGYAFIRSRVRITSQVKSRNVGTAATQQESFQITFISPKLLIFPKAFDVGIIFYSHYKNAFSGWNGGDSTPLMNPTSTNTNELEPNSNATSLDNASSKTISIKFENLCFCFPIVNHLFDEYSVFYNDHNGSDCFGEYMHRLTRIFLVQLQSTDTTFDATTSKLVGNFKSINCSLRSVVTKCLTANEFWSWVPPVSENNYIYFSEGLYEVGVRFVSSSSVIHYHINMNLLLRGMEMSYDTHIGDSINHLINCFFYSNDKSRSQGEHRSSISVVSSASKVSANRIQQSWFDMYTNLLKMRRDSVNDDAIKSKIKVLNNMENQVSKKLWDAIRNKISTNIKSSIFDHDKLESQELSNTPTRSKSFLSPKATHTSLYRMSNHNDIIGYSTNNNSNNFQEARVEDTSVKFNISVSLKVDAGKCMLTMTNDNNTLTQLCNLNETPTKQHRESAIDLLDRGQINNNIKLTREFPEKDVINIPLPSLNLDIKYFSNDTIETKNRSFVENNKEGNDRCTLIAIVAISSLSKQTVLRPMFLDFVESVMKPFISNNDADLLDNDSSARSHRKSCSDTSILISEKELSSTYSSNTPYLPIEYFFSVYVEPSEISFSCLPYSKVEFSIYTPKIVLNMSAFSSQHIVEKLQRLNSLFSGYIHLNPTQEKIVDNVDHNFNFTLHISKFNVFIFHPYRLKTIKNNTKNLKTSHGFNEKLSGGNFPTHTNSRFSSDLGDQTLLGFSNRESLKFYVDDFKMNIARTTFYVMNEEKKHYKQINFTSFLANMGPSNVEMDFRRINEVLEAGKSWFKNKMLSTLFFGKNKMDIGEEVNTDTFPKKGTHNFNTSKYTNPSTSFNEDKNIETNSGKRLPHSFSSNNIETNKSDVIRNENDAYFNKSCLNLAIVTVNASKLSVITKTGNILGKIELVCMPSFFDVKLVDDGHSFLNVSSTYSLSKIQLQSSESSIGVTFHVTKCSGKISLKNSYDEPPLIDLDMASQYASVKINDLGTNALIACLINLKTNVSNANEINTHANGETKTLELYFDNQLSFDGFYALITSSTYLSVERLSQKIDKFLAYVQASVNYSHNVRDDRSITVTNEIGTRKRSSSTAKPDIWNVSKIRETKGSKCDESNYQVDMWSKFFHMIKPHINLFNHQSVNDGTLSRKNISDTNYNSLSFCKIFFTLQIHSKVTSISMFSGNNLRSNNWLQFLFSFLNMTIKHSISGLSLVDKNKQKAIKINYFDDCTIGCGHIKGIPTEFSSNNPNDSDYDIGSHTQTETLGLILFSIEKGSTHLPSANDSAFKWVAYSVCGLSNFKHFNISSYKSIISSVINTLFSIEHLVDGLPSKRPNQYLNNKNLSNVILTAPIFSVYFDSTHSSCQTAPKFISTSTEEIYKCSFITRFLDVIYVTTDINLLLMIHTVFSKYSQNIHSKQSNSNDASILTTSNDTNYRKRSYLSTKTLDHSLDETEGSTSITTIHHGDTNRVFHCSKWSLNPKIRFLQWGSQKMEPVSVEWLMEKLKVSDIKKLVPKLIQSGILDSSLNFSYKIVSFTLSRFLHDPDDEDQIDGP